MKLFLVRKKEDSLLGRMFYQLHFSETGVGEK
jgi:hypothetical protein